MRRIKMWAKGALLFAPYAVTDSMSNRACRGIQQRFLILRHSAKQPYYHDYFLSWLESEIPSIRALFELQLLPFLGADWSRYVVCGPWLQDPAEDWMPPTAWKRVLRIEQLCAQRGIPMINPPSRLSRATKSSASRIISQLGIRVPRVVPLSDPEAFTQDIGGLRFPLIIREDRRHSAPTCLVHNHGELKQVPWSRFACPVAAEYIDVRSPNDGLYRKYRYVAAREFGVPRHLIISRHWEVCAKRREHNRSTQEEELSYLQHPDPNHETLQRARRALGLDLVAFDYSYTADGQLVVWEGNSYPNLSYPTGVGTDYTAPFVQRSFAAMAAMYLTAGRLDLHPRIVESLGVCLPDRERSKAA